MFTTIRRLLRQLVDEAAYVLAPDPEPAPCHLHDGRRYSLTCYGRGMRPHGAAAKALASWDGCPQLHQRGRNAA